MKTAYGVLNWNNDCNVTLASIKADPTDIILCTNKRELYNVEGMNVIGAVPNVAASKNLIVKKARELRYDYLFILEDDVVVKDMSIFDRYVRVMNMLDQGFIMYGFHGGDNRVYHRLNPAIMIRLNDDLEMYFNRLPCTACIGFNLNTNPLLFDEDYIMTELGDYLQRCSDSGVFKTGNGFYADCVKSDECFLRVDVPFKRVKTREMLDHDRKLMEEKKVQFKLEFNVDNLVNYLKTLNFS
jgi:hypothetical protein